ncbi:nucleotidyltransferase family protein [Pseudomonas savastanoi]|uniref:nucleotidyltransferase family protein n=1 Tax=Pseudomonas savastanoi TaxID=29438 RepID=UPI0011B4B889|nr:nucleotidyltransferase family protein [Pseudomonas savastanoi]MCQ3008465.1 nucleotidyltransferase family protein [Pseudomonas savastanoi]
MHVSNDDQPYSSATNAMEAWPETAEVFGALSHGPGRLRPAVTGRNRPILLKK